MVNDKKLPSVPQEEEEAAGRSQPEPNFGLMDSNVEIPPNPTLTLVEVSGGYCPLVT